MVMEFVRGETLEHMVDRMGPLSPQRSAELCMQSLAALATRTAWASSTAISNPRT
jgi:hypothetical protein